MPSSRILIRQRRARLRQRREYLMHATAIARVKRSRRSRNRARRGLPSLARRANGRSRNRARR